MRIVIVSSYYPWPPSVGGVETIVREVSIELARRRNEVHVVTTPFNAVSFKQVTEYGIEERDGVTIHKLRCSKLRVGYALFFKGLKDVIRRIKPDIVHSHNLHPHLFQLAKWKDEIGYKLVAEPHYPIVNIETLLPRLALPLVLKYLARISTKIESFIAHTEIERKWLIQNGINASKITKIMFPGLPSHLINYHPSSSDLKEQGDLIYVGRVVWVKGLHVLIKALKYLENDLPNISLSIVGPLNERYFRQLKKLIDELKLNEKVSIKGVVSEQEKLKLITAHKIFVLPSLGDYTPSVILEAQALGKPVVATRVGAIPEMMIEGRTGLLVKPGDARELAEAIKILLLNDDLRKKMSLEAKNFSKNFSLEASIEKLENLYYKLLN